MARKTGARREHCERIVALAKAIRADIAAYNHRSPAMPFPINDAVSRIISNDPDYVPPRKRQAERKRPPTTNPGVFTLKRIADALGTTVGALLDERGFEITASDLRTFRWMAAFLQMRFVSDAEPETALPDERSFVVKDFSFPQPLVTTKIPRKGEIAAGLSGRVSDFEITSAEIVGTMKSSALYTAIVKGRSMADRIRDGDTIVIDTAQTVPRQGDPVAVNVDNEGGILGYWRAEAGAYFLDKHNVSEFDPVKLPQVYEWRVIGVVTIVQSRVRRQDRPVSHR
jgi:SOS-response transcriptional repressor LexA